MTPEELLKPRYKVIADYPNMENDQLGVGDILMPYEGVRLYPDMPKEWFEKYPHLADLQKEEMFEEYDRLKEVKSEKQILKG